MPTTLWQIVSVLIGLATVAAVSFGTPLRDWVAMLLGIIAYALALLLLPRRKDAVEIEVAPGWTRAALDALLAEGRAHAIRLEQLVPPTGGGALSAQVRGIAGRIRQIFDEVERDPRDADAGRKFLELHLTRSVDLIAEYLRLSVEAGGADQTSRQRLEGARRAVDVIEASFQAQLDALRAHDFTQLEVSSRTLTQMLAAEHGFVTHRAIPSEPPPPPLKPPAR